MHRINLLLNILLLVFFLECYVHKLSNCTHTHTLCMGWNMYMICNKLLLIMCKFVTQAQHARMIENTSAFFFAVNNVGPKVSCNWTIFHGNFCVTINLICCVFCNAISAWKILLYFFPIYSIFCKVNSVALLFMCNDWSDVSWVTNRISWHAPISNRKIVERVYIHYGR